MSNGQLGGDAARQAVNKIDACASQAAAMAGRIDHLRTRLSELNDELFGAEPENEKPPSEVEIDHPMHTFDGLRQQLRTAERALNRLSSEVERLTNSIK